MANILTFWEVSLIWLENKQMVACLAVWLSKIKRNPLALAHLSSYFRYRLFVTCRKLLLNFRYKILKSFRAIRLCSKPNYFNCTFEFDWHRKINSD